jgi:hypothetical protein
MINTIYILFYLFVQFSSASEENMFAKINFNQEHYVQSIFLELKISDVFTPNIGLFKYGGCNAYNEAALYNFPLKSDGTFFMSNSNCLIKGHINFTKQKIVFKEFYDYDERIYYIQNVEGSIYKVWNNDPINPLMQKIRTLTEIIGYVPNKTELEFYIDFNTQTNQFNFVPNPNSYIGKKLFESNNWPIIKYYMRFNQFNRGEFSLIKEGPRAYYSGEKGGYRPQTVEIKVIGFIENDVFTVERLKVDYNPKNLHKSTISIGPKSKKI